MSEKNLNKIMKTVLVGLGAGAGLLLSACFKIKKEEPVEEFDEMDDLIPREPNYEMEETKEVEET